MALMPRSASLVVLLAAGSAPFLIQGPSMLPRSTDIVRPFSTMVKSQVSLTPTVSLNESPVAPSIPPRPGMDENARFRIDYTVSRWRDFQAADTASVIDNLREAAAIPARYATTSPAAAKYWAGHLMRTSYFLANAIAGMTAFEFSKQQQQQGLGGSNGLRLGGEVASRLVLEAMMTYEQDWQSVSRGDFLAPWDMEPFTNHRQQQPLYALRQSLRFIEEAVGTLDRRSKGDSAKGVWLDSGDSMGYPEYYQNNFHFQGDGWMSSKSANVYETSTESLFLGRQDAMQRQALLPLSEHSKKGARPIRRILEVACGTGRFGTFIRDNHPNAEMTSVDLSPFYLDAARDNHQYWQRMRGDRDQSDRSSQATRFVQAPAEALPFADGEFDAVVCVYLFHEMPSDARALAAKEMGRVLAPGGVLAFTDSIQRGDRPALDDSIVNFKNLNEPHYEDYIQSDLSAYFESAGLAAGGKWQASTSKTLSFTKPTATTVP